MAWLDASVGKVWPNLSPRRPWKVTATSNAAVREAREAMVAAMTEVFIVDDTQGSGFLVVVEVYRFCGVQMIPS